MKYVVSGLIAAVGVLALTASGASAAVVCNDEGDCWKVKDKYEYPPEVRLHVYDDDWKWEGDKYRWRDQGPDAATSAEPSTITAASATSAPTMATMKMSK